MGSLPTTKGGNVVLKEVSVPSSVEPGESMTAEIRVKNRALVIGPFDGDRCNSPAAGYKMRAGYVTPSGETKYTNEKCVPGDFSNHTWSVPLTAPGSDGSHEFEAWIEMTGSGKTTNSLTQSFSVTSTPPETPDSRDDGGGDAWNPFPDGSGGDDPLNIGGQMDKLLLVAGLIAVAWLASSGAEVLG